MKNYRILLWKNKELLRHIVKRIKLRGNIEDKLKNNEIDIHTDMFCLICEKKVCSKINKFILEYINSFN